MKRALAVAGLLGLAALVTAARPGTEQQLVQQLNGQNVRWTMPDGGKSGVFTTYDAGSSNFRGCMPLTPAYTGTYPPMLTDGGIQRYPDGGPVAQVLNTISANVIKLTPLTPVNVCVRPSVQSPVWDGGCNTLPTDENYGDPWPAGTAQYVTPDSAARYLCAISDAGFVSLPAFLVE